MSTGSVILTSPLKTMVPIVKVVGDFCNLRCRYCFYNTTDQLTRHVMSSELLEKFLVQYMELFTGRLIFIWHGGEPLLIGIPFFQKIVDLQNRQLKEGQIIQNTIQTNATLIDDSWAEFFKVHDFRVGVSLDGGKESHDHFRLNYGSGGSFDRVMQGIKILRQYGIEPGIIQTLTRDNVPRAKEDFDFFANILGAKGWGVNNYLDIAGVNKAMIGQTITNKELIQFLKTYIDLWLTQNDPNLRIREIENFISGVFKKRALNCTFNGSCAGFFCLEYDGRIYPCDRFSNRPELLLGNLSQQPLLDILNSSTRLKYSKDVNSIYPDCAVCEWQKACHNGCTIHRVGGIHGKYYYCETRKVIFAYLREKVETREHSPATQTA